MANFIQKEIAAIESLATLRGTKVEDAILKPAGIHRRTWFRWKNDGALPSLRLWEKVLKQSSKLRAGK